MLSNPKKLPFGSFWGFSSIYSMNVKQGFLPNDSFAQDDYDTENRFPESPIVAGSFAGVGP